MDNCLFSRVFRRFFTAVIMLRESHLLFSCTQGYLINIDLDDMY